METSQNIIESEERSRSSSSGGGGGNATPQAAAAAATQHHESPSSSPLPEGLVADEVAAEHLHQMSHREEFPINGDEDRLANDPQRLAPGEELEDEEDLPLAGEHPHPMDHMHEESTGSVGTSMGDSMESNSAHHHHMDDSMEAATTTAEISNEKLSEETSIAQPVAEEEVMPPASSDAAPAVTPTAAKKAKEPPTKRFKCSHCSKSYVREFQLNTHVRKYHPEKPKSDGSGGEGQQDGSGSPTTSPVKPNNAWTQADMDEALESLKTERMSLVKAGQHYGIPASTLWQRATKLGIMIPKNGARTSSKDGVADAVQLLKTGQISVNKASKVFGIPPSTLYKIAKREGIQLSSPFNSATTSWTQENLQLAMDAIRTGQMSVHMASVEFKIPPGTLYGRCKREGLELSRNNPVQWSPRDLKNALEAVKTGQMSINQASEHYKISYSSLYKRVKPHFVNNNNSSSSNHNLPKMGNELGETDLLAGGGGVIVPGGGGGVGGPGLEAVSMHHPMDYDAIRSPHLGSGHPQLNSPQSGVSSHQLQYGSGVQQQQLPQQQQAPQHHLQHPHHHQQQNHYLGQPPPMQQQPQPHHPHHPHHHHHQAAMHHYSQSPAVPPTGLQQSLPVMRQHHPTHHLQSQQHQQQALMEEQQGLHHPQTHHSQQMMHNGHLQEDHRTIYGGSLDVDKHGLTSSSGIGLNGLMGISMGFLDFAPELPAPVAVPVTEHYSLSSQQQQQQQQQQSPYSSVITKDNSGTRHPPNNGHYNGSGGGGGGVGNNSSPGHATATAAPTVVAGHHPGAAASVQANANNTNNNNNGYATLQNNYYHHSVIHSPVQYQQQQQQHHQQHAYGHPQQQHLQMHHHTHQQQSSSSSHHNHQHSHAQNQHHLVASQHHNPTPPGHHQRHGMVPMNEDKLTQKEGLSSLVDPHAATAEYDEKVIVTTINDL